MFPYLWGVDQIHFQQARLERSFHGPVVLQSIQQEGRALLDQVVLHENINDLQKQRSVR